MNSRRTKTARRPARSLQIVWESGGADETRTRGLWRDRPFVKTDAIFG